MAKLQVIDFNKKAVDEVEFHDQIVETPLSPFIIKDAVVSSLAAKRQGTHKTKGRSEVAGSTRKLFRQKGTGNSRVGSNNAPSRRHGGIVFGPVPRDHSISLNKKVRKKALISVVGEKIRQGKLIVLEDLKLKTHKTKDLVIILGKLELKQALFVCAEQSENFELASRNLSWVNLVHSEGLRIYDILNHEHLVMTKDALSDLEGRLLK
ncbi:MAG: 50S ribosomal protein L4 [Deltaproteobacteria bacterium]|nr:50S ribosomal protein L4 [Deltaproteobacteria bacterium]